MGHSGVSEEKGIQHAWVSFNKLIKLYLIQRSENFKHTQLKFAEVPLPQSQISSMTTQSFSGRLFLLKLMAFRSKTIPTHPALIKHCIQWIVKANQVLYGEFIFRVLATPPTYKCQYTSWFLLPFGKLTLDPPQKSPSSGLGDSLQGLRTLEMTQGAVHSITHLGMVEVFRVGKGGWIGRYETWFRKLVYVFFWCFGCGGCLTLLFWFLISQWRTKRISEQWHLQEQFQLDALGRYSWVY